MNDAERDTTASEAGQPTESRRVRWTRYGAELARKSVHFTSALCPIIYAFISWKLMMILVTPVIAIVVALDLGRYRVAWINALFAYCFGHMLREREHRTLSGATYVMLSVGICILLFPKPIAIAALLMMSVSDALASLVGMKAGGPRWIGDKSVAGSAAFFISAIAISWICLPDAKLAGLAGAAFATFAEATPLTCGKHIADDNLVVPLSAGAVMWLLLP